MTRSALLFLSVGLLAAAPRSKPAIVTFRDEGCSCCEGWVAAARTAGYAVTLHDLPHAERLKRFRLTEAAAGCHTSVVLGYVVEGHVPLEIVGRLLRERPHLRGIGISGMPLGIAGMSGPRTGSIDVMTLEQPPRLYARV